jgi:cell division protein FtsB
VAHAKKKRRKKSLWFRLAMFSFIVYAVFVLVDLQIDIVARRSQLEQLKIKCEEQRLLNKEMQRLLTLGDDASYIERMAKGKLGFAYPDERIFIDTSGK